MATFHETKYMGLSFFWSKSGRSNSALDLFFEGGDQLLQKERGDLQKKKVITCLDARFVSFSAEIVIEVGFAVIKP